MSPNASFFGLLKKDPSKLKPTTIDGVWNFVEEKWKSIFSEISRKALRSWKLRCRLVVQKQVIKTEH